MIIGVRDYSILFYIADGLSVVVVLLISRLDVDVERVEGGNLANGLKRLVRLVDVDVFMLMMLFLGTCWGFLESFLFVFLEELKANSYLLGNQFLKLSSIYMSHNAIRRDRDDRHFGLRHRSPFPLRIGLDSAQNRVGQRLCHRFRHLLHPIFWLFPHLVSQYSFHLANENTPHNWCYASL